MPLASLRFALPLACLVTSPLLAQVQAPAPAAAPPSDQPAYTLHTNSRLVLTDVTVTDRNGNPVHNLSASAFHIFEGKTPEDIASFEEHTAVPPRPADAPSAPPPKGVYTNNFLLHAPPVLNIIVLDITNLALEDQMYLSYQLTQFLKTMPDGEMLAIYERGGPISVLIQSFTSDRNLLLSAVHRALPRFPPRGAIYLNDIDTLQQISNYLGDLPGRKNVLWFSGGSTLYLNPDATQFQDVAAWRRVYDSLEANRIAVYPVDARGLTITFGMGAVMEAAQHGSMSEVAEATGGRAFYNNNGLQQMAARITSTGGDFYTLTYSPHNYQEDKKWHKVHITLANDGVPYTLSYRRGYFADGVNTNPSRPSGPLTRILAGGAKATDKPSAHTTPIVFEARVLPTSDLASGPAPAPVSPAAKPKKGAIPYSIRYSVPADDLTLTTDPTGKSTISIVAAAFAFNQNGSVVDRHVQRFTVTVNQAKLRLNPHIGVPLDQQLQLAKGEVYLILAVVDESSGRSGNLQIAMQVPAPPRQQK